MNTHSINPQSLDTDNEIKIKKPKKQWKGLPSTSSKGRSTDSASVMNGGGVGTSAPFNPAWFPPVDYVPSPNLSNDGGPADNLGGGFPSTYGYEILCNEPSYDDDYENCSCFPNYDALAALTGTAGNSVDFSVEFGHFPQFQGMPSGRVSIHTLNLDDNLLDGSLTFFDHPSQRRIGAILKEEQCVAVMTSRGHMRFADFSQGYAATPFGGSEQFTSRLFMVNEDGTPFFGLVENAPCFEEVFKTGMVIRYNPVDGRPIFIRTDMGRQISAEELLGEMAVIRVDKDGDWVHYEEILHSLHGSDHVQKDRIRQVWSRSDGLLDFPDASTINWYSPADVINHLDDGGFFIIRSGAEPIKKWKFETPANSSRLRSIGAAPELAIRESHGTHETQSKWTPFSEDGTCFVRGSGGDAECSVKIREAFNDGKSSGIPFRRPNGFVQNVAGRAAKLVAETKYTFKGEPDSFDHPIPSEENVETITRNIYESRESGDVLLSKTEGLNSPQERTWFYEYGQDPASPNFGEKTKTITPEGKETEMEYDEEGNLIFKREPWLIDSIRETRFSYMHEKNNDRRLASSSQMIIGANGAEVVLESVDYQYEESPLVCRKTVTTHALGVEAPQIQITETYGTEAEDFKIGQIFRTIGPDGLEVVYDYIRTNEMGAELKTIRSVMKDGAPIPGLSTRSITFRDGRGDVFKTIDQVHDGRGFATISERTMTFDELHRVIRTSYGDGRAENTEWTCFGPLWQTDADGIQTRYFYNAANRLIRQETDAIPLLEDYNAPHDTAQKPMRVYEYEYDGQGNRIATIEKIGDLVKRSSQKLDSLGRSVDMTDEMGRITSISYSPDGLTQTTVLPGGAIKTTRNSADGFLLEESSSNGQSRHYSYAMTVEGLVTTIRSGSPSGFVMEQSIQDGLGRVIKTLRPAADGSGGMIAEKVTYNERGFVASRQIDGLAPLLMEYDEFGNQSKNVVKRSPLVGIDLVADSIVETSIFHTTLPEGTPGLTPELANCAVFKETTTRRYFSDGSSNLISTQESVWVLESEVEGMTDEGIESLTISKDKYGNWGWKRAENHSGNKRVYVKTPFSDHEAEQIIVDGELIREVNEAGIPRFTERKYTSSGGSLTMTDASGRAMIQELDPFARRLKITDSLGNHVETEYDPVTGLISSLVDAHGQDTHFLYDCMGRLTEQSGTACLPMRRAYDDGGNLSSITMWRNSLTDDENEENQGDSTRWKHDPITGKIIRKTYMDGSSVSFSYDQYGRLASRTSARGILTSCSYRDLTGELISVSHSDGSSGVELSYLADGRLSQLADASGLTSFEYDEHGDLVSESTEGPVSYRLIHHRDSLGRITGYELMDSAGKHISQELSYDSLGRISSSRMDEDSTFSFRYDSVTGEMTEISYPNGIVKRIEMEEERHLVRKISYIKEGEQEAFLSHEYAYDARSLPVSQTDKRGDALTTERFEYDSRGQLLSVSGDSEMEDSSLTTSFEYDSASNRLLDLPVNSLNQYGGESRDGFSPQYDADGNQTLVRSATGIWLVEWNSDSKPVSFTQEDMKITFVYDSKGRRIEKTVWNKGGLLSRSRFVYRGALLLAEFDALEEGAPPRLKTMWHWDPLQSVATRPLASISIKGERRETLFMLHDRMKNVTALADASGSPCAAYRYAPFGEIRSMDGQAAQANPFRFSSEYADDELGLVSYTHRLYNPAEGRWISRDPAGESSSPNLYCFVGNRPSAAVDIQGMVLYAIDGTSFNAMAPNVDDRKESNVWRIYNLSTYEENVDKRYFAGPNLAGGWELVRDYARLSVCHDFCHKGKKEIDLLGRSRGAAIAIDVAAFLKICGCPCSKDKRTRDIQVDGLYLFDPVDMTWGFLNVEYIYDNVKFYVIIYDPSPALIFPQVKPKVLTASWMEVPLELFALDQDSTHNDVGGNGEDDKDKNIASRAFMMDKMRENGLEITQEDFSAIPDTTYMGYNVDYSLPIPRINTVSSGF